MVEAAAGLLPSMVAPSAPGVAAGGHDGYGAGFAVRLSPGCIRFSKHGFRPPAGLSGGTKEGIYSWSAGSRLNMIRRLSELDYSPLTAPGLPLAMLTLTAPGDWETVFPCACSWTKALRAFWLRYERTWGKPPNIWKKEFQSRGAPHLHALIAVPDGLAPCTCSLCLPDLTKGQRSNAHRQGIAPLLPFRTWLQHTWADVVAHPDHNERLKHSKAGANVDFREGARCTDPLRLIRYFSGHNAAGGGKEYQHQPPSEWLESDCCNGSVGRFWGYKHLKPAVVALHLSGDDYNRFRRAMRRWSRRQAYYSATSRYPHKVETRAGYLAEGAGFVLLNNAPGLVARIGLWLSAGKP